MTPVSLDCAKARFSKDDSALLLTRRAAGLRAHRAQFIAHDYEAALRAWDDYLARSHAGSFELEARYNRAIALAQLGRVAEARQALAPFASAEPGAYRRRAATRLLAILREPPVDDNAR